MMQLLATALGTLFVPPILCLTILVVCLAAMGRSLGVRVYYVQKLVEVFEVRRLVARRQRVQWGRAEVRKERARQMQVRRRSVHVNEHVFNRRTRVSFADQPSAGVDDVPGLAVDGLRAWDDEGGTDTDADETLGLTPKQQRGCIINREATRRMASKLNDPSPRFGRVATITDDSLDFMKVP